MLFSLMAGCAKLHNQFSLHVTVSLITSCCTLLNAIANNNTKSCNNALNLGLITVPLWCYYIEDLNSAEC